MKLERCIILNWGSMEVLAVWEQAKKENWEMELGEISQNGQVIGALVEVSNKRKQDRKSDTEKSGYASSKSFEGRPADGALREKHRNQRCLTDAGTSTGPRKDGPDQGIDTLTRTPLLT